MPAPEATAVAVWYAPSQRASRQPGWLLVLEAQTRKDLAEQARQARAKHPRKKQPRHVRIAQSLKPLNPHSR